MKPKINIGSSTEKLSGYITADINPNVNPDIILDITKMPYKFADKHFSELRCYGTLAYIDLEKIPKVLKEFLRAADVVKVNLAHFLGSPAATTMRKFSGVKVQDIYDLRQGQNPWYVDSFLCQVRVKIALRKGFSQPWNYVLEPFINMNRWMQRYYESTALGRLFPPKSIEVELRSQ